MSNNADVKTVYILIGRSNATGIYESIQGVYDSKSRAIKERTRLNKTSIAQYENFEIKAFEMNANVPLDISSGF